MKPSYIQHLQAAEKRRKRILNMKESGKTIAQIAAKFDISPQRVSQIVIAEKAKQT